MRQIPVVGPRLRRLLILVLCLFGLLTVNSFYLGGITLTEFVTGRDLENLFYQGMFLTHLALGLLLVVPVVVYGVVHWRNARHRPNRRAVKAGLALLTVSLALLATGLMLTRGLPVVEVRDPQLRQLLYWAHVLGPILVIWLFVLHRLAGPGIKWKSGAGVAGLAVLLTGLAVGWLLLAPVPESELVAEDYFYPSLARTADGGFIPADGLMADAYCAQCHTDVHSQWQNSAHRFASFNNPAYRFSVRNTRSKMLARDGNIQGARFCAGCHDPVPFFSGAFDDPSFDDISDPSASAGITCTVCHSISQLNSPRGNADYTITAPVHYPFAFSESPFLAWVSRTLVKAKPGLHKKTFLKPLHGTAEFCGACHKVHLPEELNGYRWLRGQNHYDSFLISGVSGVSVDSFYYPDQAEANCNGCHMPARASSDFGARGLGDFELAVHDHLFPGANTALVSLLGLPDAVLAQQQEFLTGSVSVDIFSMRPGGTLQEPPLAPLDKVGTRLEGGKKYLLEIVLRTRTLGHLFTEGTADSNQVWLDVRISGANGEFARSGFIDEQGMVDADAHFANAYLIDKDGHRIDQRNAEDIFTALYNHQIPPGAADVVQYAFTLPENESGPISVEAVLRYRKFDTAYYRLFTGNELNTLPVTDIASHRLVIGEKPAALNSADWERWNDYGIGLFLKPATGALRQAEWAFQKVADLGRPEGLVNLARVYLREGRLAEAGEVLARAASHPGLATPWTVDWLSGQVNFQNGFLDEAIANWEPLTKTPYRNAREKGLDFSRNYRLLERLGSVYYERARLARSDTNLQKQFLNQASTWYRSALAVDPERASSHYGLSRVYQMLGDSEGAETHRQLHDRFKIDENARDRAVAAARLADPAADRAANPLVVYPMRRPTAYVR